MSYTEFQITSSYSFLNGGSQPDELVEKAIELDYKALAITDRNTLAGVPRAFFAAKQNGMKLIVGCRLDLRDGPSLLAFPTDKAAYARLSGLLTLGNSRVEKGDCELRRQDVYDHAKGIKFIAVPPLALNDLFDLDPTFEPALKEYRQVLGHNLYLAASHYYQGDDAKRLFRLSKMSSRQSVPLIATNDVLYHDPCRRELQDILTCTREKKTIYNAGFLLASNAERHLKSPEEMARVFREYPDAIRATRELTYACQFKLDELRYEYPAEITTDGRTPQEELTHLAWAGAHNCYGATIPDKVVQAITKELAFVEQVNYAPYFLTVYDIVRFARSQGILCQGRGSAANSTVCYVLGITSVDPTKFDLLFERFISSARSEPPDIDVDFEHERREEVIQYIYEKYGRDRAAIVATVTQQRQRGAIRDAGRAMGLSVDTVDRLSKSLWQYTDEWIEKERVEENGLDINDPHLKKTISLAGQMLHFPRQLGQHTGGFVITNGKLSDLCPILNARMKGRTNIEWNKDDIDLLGFLKIDILALGMLTCIRKGFDLLRDHYGRHCTLANIPQDDPSVYDMICKADTIGVFQIESRAQQSMLPRLKPRCFYDLVIEVAIVRPGPIQGDMVHPYLRRRNGEEPVEYPSEELREILGKTLGVPLFQEQAMKIAIVAAGFTPSEADELRRSMATFKFQGMVNAFEKKLVNGMMAKGYEEDFAKRVFKQLEGFGSYGFPESHAASFAHLVYASSWMKCHYPDVFGCAILNSQPMGFYHPAQLVDDARKHGVTIRPVDVNHSEWDNTLEEVAGRYRVLRLGFRQVKGLREQDIVPLIAKHERKYTDIATLWHLGVTQTALELLADADAFNSMGLNRRQALWEVTGLAERPAALFVGHTNEAIREPIVELPAMMASEQVVQDYASMSLSLKGHPVSFVREKLKKRGITPNAGLSLLKDAMKVKVSGLVLVRQRPGTAGGVCFMTIEDETGCANLVVFKHLFEKFRKEILHAKLLMAEGKLQIEGEVIHVVVQKFTDLSSFLENLTTISSEPPLLALARADERSALAGKVFSEGRNFR